MSNNSLVFGKGYKGYGPYPTRKDGKRVKAYARWYQILRRCYCPKALKRKPYYLGCQVGEEWLNYQNFASWFYKNKLHLNNWEIDKDILFKGNKTYSPQTCCVVPRAINCLLTKATKIRGDLPIGVHKVRNSYIAQISITRAGKKRKKHLGSFSCPLEAFQAYKKAKEDEIKLQADLHKKEIDPHVYSRLYEYEVELND